MPTLEELFSDRNFLSLLAGTGARLGAGGAGEAIGVPTQQFIQGLAAQEVAAKQEKRRSEFDQMLKQAVRALAGEGGLTPKEVPGPTSVKQTPTGMSIDITTPVSPGAGIAGGASAAPTEQEGTESEATSLLPFFRALGGY